MCGYRNFFGQKNVVRERIKLKFNNRGQTGINDTSIAGGIIIYLTILSLCFTALEVDFNQPSTTTTILTSVTTPTAGEFTVFGAFILVENFINYMTFAIGTAIPLWVNLIFLFIPKLILFFILVKNLVPFLGGG